MCFFELSDFWRPQNNPNIVYRHYRGMQKNRCNLKDCLRFSPAVFSIFICIKQEIKRLFQNLKIKDTFLTDFFLIKQYERSGRI